MAAWTAGLAAALLVAAGALGWGEALVSALGLRNLLRPAEARPVAFALGVAILGWLGFFWALAGFLGTGALLVLVVPGLAGLLLPGWRPLLPALPADPVARACLAGIAAMLLLGLVASTAPPADADTLAYHFATPKLFLREGHLVLVPRALDGVIPMLLHMTYMTALGLGGEAGLVLWATLVGWAGAWLLAAVALRFLPARWALLLALLHLTTPAVLFASNSGQIELRLALFATVALMALVDARTAADPAAGRRLAVLAGLAAGAYAGAKLTGLILVGAGGLALLAGRDRWARAVLYGAAALAVGVEWYVWNWLQTGDPVFPALYAVLGARDHLWTPWATQYLTATHFAIETPAPRTLLWAALYPLAALLAPPWEAWDAGRTGLGPVAALLLPFALAAVARRPRRLAGPAGIAVAVIGLCYLIWFFSGVSQRIRHVLPFYPVALVLLAAAAQRAGAQLRLRAPVAAAIGITLVLQAAGAAVFHRNYVQHLLTGESRTAFLERNLARFQPVPWLNAHLGPGDRVLLTERQLVYAIDGPATYTAQPQMQHLVELAPGRSDPRRFLEEIRALGITHVLIFPALDDFARGERHYQTTELVTYVAALAAAGCAEGVYRTTATAPRSRTVPGLYANEVSAEVVAIRPGHCPLP